MREIGAFEAKNRFGTLLDEIERGEEIIITRRGKVVAKLIPANPGVDREQARAAANRIIARQKGVMLGGLTINDLIAEGRP